jgi:hypothetical protein
VTGHTSPREGRCRFLLEGLRRSSLSEEDAALASVTPELTTKRFTQLFGGTPRNERPRSREYNIICVTQVPQPYAPRAPGEPGVLFIFPSIVRLEDDYMSFHLFIETSSEERRYRYLGIYTKVPPKVPTDTTVKVGEWLTLPMKVAQSPSHVTVLFFCCLLLRLLQFRSAWSLRVYSSIVPDVRTVHARISIRNSRPHGHLPSPDEINAWLTTDLGTHKRISMAMVNNAFNSGEEVSVCLEGAIVGLTRASSPEHQIRLSKVHRIRR